MAGPQQAGYTSYTMEARVGRTQQRYGAGGERLVAGVVPLSSDKTKVLVVESARRNGWVLPKGGWEADERTPEDAAVREAWEEAGIVIRIVRDLGSIADSRDAATLARDPSAQKALYQFYEVTVDREEAMYPEMYKRNRT